MILLWLATAVGQPLGLNSAVLFRAASISRYLAYEDCLKNKATVAGIFTSEAPRAVVLSVEPKCAAEWQQFRSAFFAGQSQQSAEDRRSLDHFRSLAIGSATSELVVGRAGSCGTQPGPYQCKEPLPAATANLTGGAPF